jgi:molecular chaperone HtpG
LTDSAVCLVADDSDLDIHLERLLRQHRQVDKAAKRILEINPSHALTRRLVAAIGRDGAAPRLNDVALLLYDQARIVEGEAPSDPARFARLLTAWLAEGGLP